MLWHRKPLPKIRTLNIGQNRLMHLNIGKSDMARNSGKRRPNILNIRMIPQHPLQHLTRQNGRIIRQHNPAIKLHIIG